MHEWWLKSSYCCLSYDYRIHISTLMVQVSYEWPRKTGTLALSLWLVQKIRATFSTNQMHSQNKSEIIPGVFPRFRRLAYFYFNFYWRPVTLSFALVGCSITLDLVPGSRPKCAQFLQPHFFMILCKIVLSCLFYLEMGTLDFLELRYRVSSSR